MKTRSWFAALFSGAAVMSLGLTGAGISPAVASNLQHRVTCAGPSRAEARFYANAKKYGIHAEEMVYQRSLIGCVPVRSNGLPKPNLLQNALHQQRVMPDLISAGSRWNPIGPAPIGSGNSGRILSMAWDSALSTLFIGAADGGIWYSKAPYSTWTVTGDTTMTSLTIGALAVDPSDKTGKTIYAGTGEQAAALDALYGQGIYKSTDGGSTWSPTGAPTGGWGLARISKIVITTAGTVFAAEGSGFAGGALFMSTDKGATWTQLTVVSATDSITDLAIDGSDNIYAAVGEGNQTQADNGVYECASPCTAASVWTLLGGGTGGANGFPASGNDFSIKIAVTPTTAGGGGTAVYAIASDSSAAGGHSAGNAILGVYRLLPGSATWSQILTPDRTVCPPFPAIPNTTLIPACYENQAWYDLYIWADPHDASGATVYFGLSDIYQSTNATAAPASVAWTNLTQVYGAAPAGVHPDQHAVTSDGGANLFFGNDGGAWMSTNGGTSFSDINGNLATLQFYGGSLGTALGNTTAAPCQANCDPTARIGGMQDNGTAQTTAGNSVWTADPGFGDGGPALIDPTNNNYRYGQNANGDLQHSVDGGATFNDMGVNGTCGASNFYGPIALDPNAANPAAGTLLSGQGDLCESTNPGAVTPSWTDISSPGGTPETSSAIGAIAISNAGGKTVFYIADSGYQDRITFTLHAQVFYSTDSGTTWTQTSTTCPSPDCAAGSVTGTGPGPSVSGLPQVTSLAADPSSPGVLYATMNGFQGSSANHVFKWTNTGLTGAGTWTDISGTGATGLPDEPYDTVAINPQSTNEIYVGGITGVFVTTNGGTSWSQMGTSLPNVQVDNLQVSADGASLVAFTHGRSAWQINANPTAVAYSRLVARVSHGWTFIRWRSTRHVAGFDVYQGRRRLNRRPVTSRTNRYSFRIHGVVHHPRVAPILLR